MTARLLLCFMNLYITNSLFINFTSRCPSNTIERVFRSSVLCLTEHKYHCIYADRFSSADECQNYRQLPQGYTNTDRFPLVEICQNYKQLPSGNFPKYSTESDNIYYEACAVGTYQLGPAKSFELTECMFIKSACVSEGQIECTSGNPKTDSTCRCDYKNGYAMMQSECCSNSLYADCTCYKKDCPAYQEMLPDYNCVDKCQRGYERKRGESTCTVKNVNSVEKTVGNNTIESAHYNDDSLLFVHDISPYFISVVVLIFILYVGCCVYLMCVYDEMQVVCTVYNETYAIKVFKLLKAAKEGNVEELKCIAGEGYVDMADVNYDHRSALHLAACEGHVETVKFLLENNFCNIESTDRWKRTVLDDVMWHQKHVSDKNNYSEIIRMITEYELPYRHWIKETIWHMTAAEVIYAAETGNLLELKRLKNKGTDMDLSDFTGRTALHAASEHGIEKVVNYLIDSCGVSPFKRFRRKRPIDLLVDVNSSTNEKIRNKLKKTMENMLNQDYVEIKECPTDKDVQINRLFNCAAKGDIKSIRAFRKAGYDMTLCDYDKRTVLHIAVSENQEHIVDYLLGDCDLTTVARTAKDRWNVTPLEAAKDHALSVVDNVFLKHCKELIDTASDDYKAFRLITAAAKGDTRMFKEKNVDMNLMDYDKRTALHLAAAEGHLETVEYLVNEAKVNLCVPDRHNRYPADDSKNEDIQGFLKTAKNSNDTPPSDRISPATKTLAYMMDAASKGKLHLIKDDRYKYQYFTMDSTDYFRNTPLHVAAVAARLDDVNYLLDEKLVSPFVRNGFLETPLDLVNRKIKIEGLTEDCTKPQPYGAEEQKRMKSRKDEFVAIRDKLVSAMKLASTEDVKEDVNFVHHAEDVKIFLFLDKAYKGDIKAIRRYIKTDPTLVNKVNYDKRSALHIAAAEGHFHLVEFLLDKTDVDINAQDRWNVTPLMEAMRIDDHEIIKLLQQRQTTNIN